MYSQAIDKNPEDHTIYSNRASAYQSLEKYSEALKDAERSIEIKPDFARGYQRKAQALQSLGKFEEAMQAVTAGLA